MTENNVEELWDSHVQLKRISFNCLVMKDLFSNGLVTRWQHQSYSAAQPGLS